MMPSGRRVDFQCTNRRGLKLKCSLYIPNVDSKGNIHQNINNKCIIYLHSMNGSRLESNHWFNQVLGISR